MNSKQMSKEDLIEENAVLRKQIEEYKQIEEKLNLKEKQYYTMIEDMTEFVTRQTPDMKLTFVNDAYCNFLGKKREEMLGTNELIFIHEEDHKMVEYEVNSFDVKNPVKVAETRWENNDGKTLWVEWTCRAFFNECDELVEYQAVGRDITERKKAQEKLKKSRDELEVKVEERTVELSKANKELTALNSYLNSILKNVSEGVAVIDELGSFENMNAMIEKTWGVSLRDIEENFKNSILEEKHFYINKMLKKKESFRDVEFSMSTKKGDVNFLISGTPIDDQRDGISKGVIVYRPIKEVHKLVNRFSGAQAKFRFKDIITKNKKMLKIVQRAQQAALSNSNVLIQGESGTGKEMFAQAIHNQSNRRNGPFVAVNCGAIPRELIGSELFGYSEGAFTGAKKGGKPGKFELASGGTIFLDEIGDMPFEQQVALLRVIQEKNVNRIGGNQVIPIDVRIICATNKDLLDEMKKGNFRTDLYYRLNVISIKIPPLRDRREDIILLFKHFLDKTDKKWCNDLKYMDCEINDFLTKYNWPGNVRELENVVERMIYVSDGADLSKEHLPENIYHLTLSSSADELTFTSSAEQGLTLNVLRKRNKKYLEEKERDEILDLLNYYNGNVSQVAKKLGIARSTLYRKMKTCRIID